METLHITKVKPKPDGYWFTGLRDVLRAMRESTDFIAVTSDNQMLSRAEMIGQQFAIKDQVFVMRPDGIVTRVHVGVTH